MKFVLLSDVHATSKTPIARKDDMLETFLAKFRFVLDYAMAHGCRILQAGDLFHRPRDWYLLFHVMKLLKQYPEVPVYSIYGSHDMYLYSDVKDTPTSLGILARANLIKVLKATPVKLLHGDIQIYGASVNQFIPECHVTKNRINILVIHAPICDRPLYPDHQYKSAKLFVRKHKAFNLILCGDIHRMFFHLTDKSAIVNTGPMLRMEATDYNFHHMPCFFVFDTEYQTFDKVSIPHEKADDVLSRTHLETKEHINEVIAEFIESLHEMPDVTADIIENIERYLEQESVDKAVKDIIAGVISHGSD